MMTTDDEFEAWWLKNARTLRMEKVTVRAAYLAAREATAKRCVELCRMKSDPVAPS